MKAEKSRYLKEKTDMKIGVLVVYEAGVDIEKELQKVKDLELSCCQISCWDPTLYTDENAKAINDAVEKTGIEVSALWAGWSGPAVWNFTEGPHTLGLVPKAYRFIRLKELMAASDFAEKINVANVATHVGFLPEVPSDEDFVGVVAVLKNLVAYMKKKGQTFLFETGQETPITMLRAIEAIGMDNVGINFDTANLVLYGKANTVDALDVFGKYVRNTHCKDGEYPTTGAKLGKEVPLGAGRANMPEVMRKLNALNYDGPYIIEREISGEEQIKDIIKARDLLLEIEKEV